MSRERERERGGPGERQGRAPSPEPTGGPLLRRGIAGVAAILTALLLVGVAAGWLQQRRGERVERGAQDQIEVNLRPGRTSLGAGGNFFVTALLVNTGPGVLQAVDSRWRGVGLSAVTEIGGLGPVAPGTSASFVARLLPDCGLLAVAPDQLAGGIDIVLQAPSGRRSPVRLEFDRELELAGTARAACAETGLVRPRD